LVLRKVKSGFLSILNSIMKTSLNCINDGFKKGYRAENNGWVGF
jgi:hypothetical protein